MSLFLALLLAAPQSGDLICPHRPSMLPDPVIRDEDAAKAVFSAIADQFMGGQDWSDSEIRIDGRSGDRRWTIYHIREGKRGGAGMEMTIDRCTGAVSKLNYSR